jgi:hypothetical protein
MKSLYLFLFLFVSFLFKAQTFESFNFTGALNANGWTTHSGTAGQLQTLTSASNSGASLYYNNLPLSAGNRAQLIAGNSEDVNKAITGISGTGYFSFQINVPNTTGMNTAGDYFTGFAATAGSAATSLAGKVFIKPGTVANTFQLGILNITGTQTFGTTNYPCNTTHFVVVKLKASVASPVQNAQASLYVNPVPGSTEPTATVTNSAASSAYTAFASIFLRQGGNAAVGTGNIELDEFRYGSTWASVTPLNTVSCVSYDISNVAKCSSYQFNNQTYTTSGTYMITLPNANAAGCDSVITLNLIIKQPSFSTINITNCGEYTLNGSTYTSTGQYTQTLIDANAVGCDSTITLNLNIVSSINYYQDLDNDGYGNPNVVVSACSANPGYVAVSGDCNDNNALVYPGATEVPENGVDEDCNGLDAPLLPIQLGIYQFTGTTTCPSSDNAVVSQPTNATFSLFSTLNTTCSSSAGVFNNSAWNQSANIDLNEYNQFSISSSSCNKLKLDRIAFHHRASSTGGTPTWVIRSSLDNYSSNIGSGLSGNNGGVIIDDTVYLGTTFHDLSNVSFRFYLIGMGSSSATWRMDNVSLFGNVIAITTPILQSATISSNATSVCAGTDVTFTSTSTNTWSSATYQWQLNNLDISGATSSSYTSANLANLDSVRLIVSTSLGCIANPIFTSSGIEISVNSSSTNSTLQTACGSYLWNGTTYNSSGVYTGATTNCVTESLNLTINPSSTNSTSQSACGSYTWNGTTYTASGVYTGETVNCVTESLNLTITPSSTNSTSQSACGSYTWNGTTYNASGVYTGETVNCVTESLNLTITPSSTNSTSQSACGSYTWNGTTYNASGVYTSETLNCVTESLNLTITPSSTNSTSQLACGSYTWNGTTYNTSGVYTGATSNCVTETLDLTITPSSINTTTTSASGSYTWNGQTYTSSGVYTGTTENCVTQELNLTITPLTASLSLQMFLDGYYIYGSNPASMRAARYINLIESGSANPGAITDVDVITVELRSTASINVVAYSVSPILQKNGSVQCTFPVGALGNSYYVVVKHRSSLPLWSANPVTISGSTALNFSNNIATVYTDGSVAPMSTLVSGLNASRLGELNGDGYLDGVDYTVFETDIYLSQYGGLYLLNGDLNGDAYVDASDFSVFDFNASLGSYEQRP